MQTSTLDLRDRLGIVAARCGYRSEKRYRARSEFVFRGVPLTGARVLDVGCGPGAFGLWAALNGASRVLGVEPEVDGSTEGVLKTFQSLIDELGLEDIVEARACPVEDVSPADGPFDVIVMFNVINHLDEELVTRLHFDEAAATAYCEKLRSMRSLARSGARIIVADCGRRNFWHDIGMQGPLSRTIEWDKHQQPKIWISLFERAGYRLADCRWSSLYPFGELSANALVQYFTTSHFVLTFISG